MASDEGKKRRERWKACLWSLVGAVVGYGVLQMLNALLVSRAAVGEENAGVLVCLSAGIAVFAATMIGLRDEGQGRLVLCAAVVAGFAVIILCGVLTQEREAWAWGNVAGILLAALLGGLAAAVAGGKRPKRKRKLRRR